jgi:HEAT repeat protein
MVSSEDVDLRRIAADLLKDEFSSLIDREAAWKDLHRLTGDQDSFVRSMAAHALGASFQHLTDRDTACKDQER